MRLPRRFSTAGQRISRREFQKKTLLAAAAGICRPHEQESDRDAKVTLALAKGRDRKVLLKQALELLGPIDFAGKDIYLKASFNSADEFPGSTHPESLRQVAAHLRERNCRRLLLLERSGMGATREIWHRLGIPDLAHALEMTLLPLEEISPEDWRHVSLDGWHWKQGIEAPKFLDENACVVQICNLRTHRFGGHFSASLKNSIGMIAKYGSGGERYNYMAELHASPDQRRMIAEVNQIYAPRLVIMDAMQVFVDGGPEKGDLAYPEVIAASSDRVAIDAVGVALLRLHGAAAPVSRGGAFEQDQIERAVEIKLGVQSPRDIQFLHSDDTSLKVATQINALLEKSTEEKKR